MNRKSKKGGFTYVKQLTDPISGCNDKKTYNLMGGNASQGRIATYAYYTPDWYDVGEKRPFAVDATVGINEYQFGRTTPDNKFVVASGLVGNDTGLLMTGGKKKVSKRSTKKPVKKSVPKKSTPKKSPSKKMTLNSEKDENFLKSVRKLFGMNTTNKKKTNKAQNKKLSIKKSTTKKLSKRKTTKPKRSSKRLTKK